MQFLHIRGSTKPHFAISIGAVEVVFCTYLRAPYFSVIKKKHTHTFVSWTVVLAKIQWDVCCCVTLVGDSGSLLAVCHFLHSQFALCSLSLSLSLSFAFSLQISHFVFYQTHTNTIHSTSSTTPLLSLPPPNNPKRLFLSNSPAKRFVPHFLLTSTSSPLHHLSYRVSTVALI